MNSDSSRITSSQYSSGCSAAGLRRIVPALFTKMSMAGKSAFTLATKSRTASRLPKSQRYPLNLLPRVVHFPLDRAAVRLKRLADADDVSASLSKRKRECLADTPTASSDQRGFSIQLEQFENVHVFACVGEPASVEPSIVPRTMPG